MAAQEQWEQAGRLSGAASALCPVAGPSRPVQDASEQHLTALATAAIGEATWASARAAGQSLSLDRAIAEALVNT